MTVISDQKLQAFVDGELDRDDRASVLLEMDARLEIRARVEELRRLKDGIQLAYCQKDEGGGESPGRIGTVKLTSAALLGAALMWVFMYTYSIDLLNSPVPESASAVPIPALDPMTGNIEKVIFHLTSGESEIAEELLDQVELVANSYERSNRRLRIEVVANNEGLHLFQRGRTQHEDRINAIYTRYDNITFAACGATRARLSNSGDFTELIPQAIVVDSGVAEITRRQLQGWKYIRI